MVTVTALHVYPVKSARGLAVDDAEVGDRGFEGDRRFMVVDARGRFLTQRKLPRMALLEVALEDGGARLRLSAEGAGGFTVPSRPERGQLHTVTRTVEVWRDRVLALALGPEPAAWLSRFLGVPCALVYMPEATQRRVDPDYAPEDARVGFADGFPFLLASTDSLAELARRGADVPMSRFRPNLVVSGAAPFAEDTWKTVRIGEVTFEVCKPCSRCAITTTDQLTGVVGQEPLATLRTFRRAGREVRFGQNLVHRGRGHVRVGDGVTTL
jgi:uncharacterized protein